MANELQTALEWHEAGRRTSPNAMSVRHTQVLVNEIERLRESAAATHAIVERRIRGHLACLEREGSVIDVLSTLAVVVGLDADAATPAQLLERVRALVAAEARGRG